MVSNSLVHTGTCHDDWVAIFLSALGFLHEGSGLGGTVLARSLFTMHVVFQFVFHRVDTARSLGGGVENVAASFLKDWIYELRILGPTLLAVNRHSEKFCDLCTAQLSQQPG